MTTPFNPNISIEENRRIWAKEAIEAARAAFKRDHEKYGMYCDICKRDLSEYAAGPYRKINNQWHCYDCGASHDKHN